MGARSQAAEVCIPALPLPEATGAASVKLCPLHRGVVRVKEPRQVKHLQKQAGRAVPGRLLD